MKTKINVFKIKELSICEVRTFHTEFVYGTNFSAKFFEKKFLGPGLAKNLNFTANPGQTPTNLSFRLNTSWFELDLVMNAEIDSFLGKFDGTRHG